jgi:hypothetical protein
MARPRKPFNWDSVDALISMRATEKYIAEYLLKKEDKLGPHEITAKAIQRKAKLINRRIQERWGMSFVQFREQKQEDWRIELTQLQRKAAREGKIAMQIWLGKQDLEQRDKSEVHETFEPLILNMPLKGESITVTKKGSQHVSHSTPATSELPQVPVLPAQPSEKRD